jgi:redox-regulated HSP33 family molecular chaperone
MQMTLYTHIIQISEQTFQRLSLLAQAKQTTVNEVADRTLTSALPPSIDHVPERWRTDLQQMQLMSDEMLWRIARAELPAARAELYDQLVEARQQRILSPAEEQQLETLQEESDLLLIHRSYAWLLLQSRGHKTPDPYSLASYE